MRSAIADCLLLLILGLAVSAQNTLDLK